MWNDVARNTLVPLLLRVVLAVVFVYSGLHKIVDKGNAGGADWAASLKTRDVQLPPDLQARVQQFLREKEGLPDNASPEQKKALMQEFIAGLTRPEEEPVKEGQHQIVLPPDIQSRLQVALDETTSRRYAKQEGPAAAELHASIQLLVAWGEVLGGVALLVGFLTRWAALGLVAIQSGAIYMVTWAEGFSSLQGGGYAYNIALIAMLLALALAGGGALAADRLRARGRTAAARQPAPMVHA
jgi:uncharacterized membrane protein YphA (DoxX/SURF4 family)